MQPERPSLDELVASLWGSDDSHGCLIGVPARGNGNAGEAARPPVESKSESPPAVQVSLPMGQKITLRIPGKPQPGGSKRAFTPKGWNRPVIVDANPAAVDWKRTVQAFAQQAMTWRVLDGPLRVAMTFFVPRLQGHFGARGLRPSAPKFPVTKPDVLKLARSTEDALTGIVWTDDARIVDEHLCKRYTTDGWTGAGIEIEEIVG